MTISFDMDETEEIVRAHIAEKYKLKTTDIYFNFDDDGVFESVTGVVDES